MFSKSEKNALRGYFAGEFIAAVSFGGAALYESASALLDSAHLAADSQGLLVPLAGFLIGIGIKALNGEVLKEHGWYVPRVFSLLTDRPMPPRLRRERR